MFTNCEMESQYNLRSPAVKRLMKEAQELSEATEQFYAQPLEDNLFEWHFTIRGPADSEFDGGIYHGRIVLPPEYPMKPPSIIILTPNGRFETHKKICLSISGYHPETWQPSWSLRTALLAIIGFMPTHGNGAIGSLDYTTDERKALAKRSVDWKCEQCGLIRTFLRPVTEASEILNKEAKELGAQINLQGEKEKTSSVSDTSNTSTESSSPPVPTTSTSFTPNLPPSPVIVGAVPQALPYPQFPPFMFPPGRMPPFIPPNMAVPPSWPNPPFPIHHSGFPWPPFPPCQPFTSGSSMSFPNTPQVQVATTTVERSASESSGSVTVAPSTSATSESSPSSSSLTPSSPTTTSSLATSSIPTTTSSLASATSSLSASTPLSGTHQQQQQQSVAVSSASTSVSSETVSASNEVRRRHVASVSGEDVVTTRQPASHNNTNSWLVNILVVILVICILILLSRRAYLTYTR